VVAAALASVAYGAPVAEKRQACSVGFVFARGSGERKPVVRHFQVFWPFHNQANILAGQRSRSFSTVCFEVTNTWPTSLRGGLCSLHGD
jgi:hypothetical protein